MRIIAFLCSDSGSHDNTINRREAVELGLKVDKCSEKLYELLRLLRTNFPEQMELRVAYDPSTLAQPGENCKFDFTRASNSHYQFILDFLLVWADFQSDCGLFCLRGGDRRSGRLFGKVGGCDGSQERAPVLEHGVVDHGANVIQQSIPRSLCQEASSFAIASTMGRASSAVMPDFSRGS